MRVNKQSREVVLTFDIGERMIYVKHLVKVALVKVGD